MEIEYDNHSTWLDAAEELRISSEVLKLELIKSTEAMNYSEMLAYFNSYMLLLGFHFENYLKGKSLEIYKLSVDYSKPNSFNDLKKIWKANSGHELLKIYESCGLEVKEMESNFLKRLQTHIEYAGRYKTPKNEYGWNLNDRVIKKTDAQIGEQIKKRIQLKIKNG